MTIFSNERRRGQVLVVATVGMVPLLLVILAMVADVGEVIVQKAALQNTADAAVLAAAQVLHTSRSAGDDEAAARAAALAEAQVLQADNDMSGALMVLQFGERNEAGEFVALGTDEPATVVTCTIARNDQAPDGRIELFFSPIFGQQDAEASSAATCQVFNRISGVTADLAPFAVPESKVGEPGTTLTFYPAGEDDGLNGSSNGNGNSKKDKKDKDNGNGDTENGSESGGNGDTQTTSGNWGLLDLDGGSNSNADIAYWIRHGYQEAVILSDDGYLWIDGTPGWRASNEDDLVWRIANNPQCTVLVYTEVTGNGANASYKCIGFLNVTLLSANLNGPPSSRAVTARIDEFRTLANVIVSDDVGYASPNIGKLMLTE